MKIILLIFLFISTIYADDIKLKASIFNNITCAISSKDKPMIYLHTKIKSLTTYPGDLIITQNCEKADVVLLSSTKNIPTACNDKILFGTRYSHLKNKHVIGSFFWQKGRPNILFYKDRLQKNHIKLDSSFDKYIETE